VAHLAALEHEVVKAGRGEPLARSETRVTSADDDDVENVGPCDGESLQR